MLSLSVPRAVVDASVVINLLATGRLREIIRATIVSALVVEQVTREIRRDPRERHEASDILLPYFSDLTLSQVSTENSEDALELYLDLVSAERAGLGDGEAASIAYAATHECAVVLDERKARAVCRRRFPQLQVFSSIDLGLQRILATRSTKDATLAFSGLVTLRLVTPAVLGF